MPRPLQCLTNQQPSILPTSPRMGAGIILQRQRGDSQLLCKCIVVRAGTHCTHPHRSKSAQATSSCKPKPRKCMAGPPATHA